MAITRSNIKLPNDVSSEIIAKATNGSAVMSFARNIILPGRGAVIPVITGEPVAEFVKEGNAKPVSDSTVEPKYMNAHKIAVIEVMSEEFVRDASALYDNLIQRLPAALARRFDKAVLTGDGAPSNTSGFDTLADLDTVAVTQLGTDVYASLVTAESAIAEGGYLANGMILSPQAKSKLLSAVDGNGRPLFVNSAAEGAVPMVLGMPAEYTPAAYGKQGTTATYGIMGDWTQALAGTVEGVRIDITDQATVNGTELWTKNLVAVRAEIEVGFAADAKAFTVIAEG